MIQLSDEQLNQLGKEALVVIVSSLQDQLLALQSQLDQANAQLSDNNRQIELLTEQIRIMNQRFFGRKSEAAVSEVDGQLSLTQVSLYRIVSVPDNPSRFANRVIRNAGEIGKFLVGMNSLFSFSRCL